MYNSKVEPTTSRAIKHNLNGIKKISKERILIELFKILDLKNFININDSEYLKELFSLVFPEFDSLEKLKRLKKICDYSQINRDILLATLLIGEKNNHEYFAHKYNISNEVKENLNLFAKDLELLEENIDFFDKNLEKNIYLSNKKHLINLNILNFVNNSKFKLKDFSKILKKILQSKTHVFPINGKYLMQNGMKQGFKLGRVLKLIEDEWIKNGFKISKSRVEEIVKLNEN